MIRTIYLIITIDIFIMIGSLEEFIGEVDKTRFFET